MRQEAHKIKSKRR